jgi:hypothetical protein
VLAVGGRDHGLLDQAKMPIEPTAPRVRPLSSESSKRSSPRTGVASASKRRRHFSAISSTRAHNALVAIA